MKTLLNLLNRTANAVKISGGGSSHILKCLLTILVLLTLGVGNAWGNVKHPVYCAISPSSLGDGTLKLKVTKGDTYDGGVEYITEMTKIPTTIHKSETGETKDLYYAIIEYVEDGLNYMSFEIYDGDNWREKHEAFNTWWTSPGYTKPIFDYENGNFTTYPANLAEKTSYVYFNAAEWTDAYDYIQLASGHGLYQGYNQLFKLSNTTIYYGHPTLNWSDAVQIAFLGHHEMFGTGNNWLTDLPANADAYTGFLHYSLQENSYNYFARNTNDAKGTAVSDSYLGTESTDWQKLNKTQTVQARVKATGSSYSDAAYASWPGSVSVARTYMSSATATSTPSAANMTSATTDAILTSSITLTASANSGYYFEGWGDASDSNPTDGTAAKTYTITDAKTSYAFFSQAYTLTYERKGDYSTSTVTCFSVADFSGTTTSGSSIPTGHMITLVASPATGYEVEGWYSDASCQTAYTSGSGDVTIEDNNTFKLATINANTEVYCKFQPKTYTINLVGMEATTPGTTSVDVTYNASTHMTASDPIAKPTKTNYDFGGYWVRNEDTQALVTKLIDEDGKWIANVEGYTGNDGAGNPTWVHDYPISLYAMWTETAYTITATANPAAGGSVNTVTDAHLTIPSSAITATPTNAAWVFDRWEYGEHVGCASGCSTNSVTVTSDMNSTITANFAHRYNLLGSKYENGAKGAAGGMPGWTYGSGADFTINSYTADGDNATVDLSYTCTLDAGTYIFEIHDRELGESLGRKADDGGIYQLTDGSSVELRGGTDKDQSIFFYPQHAGQYTFRITYMRKNGVNYYPTVTIERPHQMHMGHKRVDIDGTSHNDDTGGTLTASTGGNDLENGDWYNYNVDIAFEAAAETGYTLTWYTNSDYSSAFSPQPAASWPNYNVTGDENVYAQFTEKSTSVTLANDGHGKVQINSTDKTSTTCGITTTRSLTAVPNDGYMFSSWTKTSGDDIAITSTSTNPTTLSGLGAGAASGQTVTANFTPNTYTVRFENLGADKGHKGSLDTTVTFNDTIHMKGRIEVPSKAHYEFGGYYISTDKGATLTNIQIIDANGNWNKNVSGYTGTKDNVASWVCAGDTVLYAKWTETSYTITPSVSPTGAGSVNTVTDAHLITPSSTITATPVNAAWVFDRWEYGENVGCASGCSTNSVTVTSDMNSTITAHFKPRYELVGCIWDNSGNGGMPGWSYDGTGEFTVNSFTALGTGEGTGVDLSYSCTLWANTTYKFEVHDRVTGNHGKYYAAGQYLNDGEHALLNQKNNDVPLAAIGAGTYTFRITNMTYDGTTDDYFPTITVERPHQLHFGTGYAGIDNLSSVTSGTTGGTLAVTTSAGSLSNEDWVTYGTDVTYTPSEATGYTFEGFYSSNEYSYRFTQNNPWVHYNVTGDDHVYAKFEEKSTSVTLANDGHGKVQISSTDKTNTTCGVTTTRSLTAVPNAGYKFSSWVKSGDDITLSSTSTNPTTLTGRGSGLDEGQTVTANFVERYSIKGTMNGEDWGTTHTLSNIGTNASSKDTCYVTMTLPANMTYEFAIYDEQTDGWYKAGTDAVHDMTYTNHTNWEFGDTKTYNCGITTAGKGTYKFIFNITDTTVTVVYPTSYQVNYGASVGGSVTVVDGDGNAVPNGGYVVAGGSVTYTPAENSGYSFAGWYTNDTYGTWFSNNNPWVNSSIAAASNGYAKFTSDNFVIYRSGDKDDDPRAALDDVESYDGGTISEAIEFRMKVRELDKWYTLCLPFEVNAVKVWDEADCAYYDLLPYYRPEVGDKLQGGHYIIRTPKTATDLAITEFGDWRDPTSPTGYKPSANTPYIIQWHMSYFDGKYVSFFGAAGQDIHSSMSAGTAPTASNVVNVCVNNSMTTGSATGAYMLENDYGSDGAWLREEDVSAARTILPFECYVLANTETTERYHVIRRDMTITETPTGFDKIMPDKKQTNKVIINGQLFIIRDNKMYNIYGKEVQQ